MAPGTRTLANLTGAKMNRQRGGIEMLIIYAVLAAGAVAVLWAAWAGFTDSYRDEGRAEIRDQYGPIIAECDKRKLAPAACVDHWLAADRDQARAVANLAGCQAAAAAQSDAIAQAETAARDAKAATSRILAGLAKRSDATLAEIARLRTIAATPAASRKEAGDEADILLRNTGARRMRYNPGPAAVGGGSNSGDSGTNPGPVHIRP